MSKSIKSLEQQLAWLEAQPESCEREELINYVKDELSISGYSTYLIRCDINEAKAFYRFREIKDKLELINQLYNIINHDN